MRILGLIALYAVALFLMGHLLLDVESMLVSELTANKELDFFKLPINPLWPTLSTVS
jgi:hypothetical protein